MRRLPLLLVFLFAGCAGGAAHRDAGENLAGFEPLAADPRVRHEPGAADCAGRVAAALPQAVAQVEAEHRRAFVGEVVVYMCGTDACFADRVPKPPNLTAAVAWNNRLILHPRLCDREPQRLPGILTHELSHLHLGQQLGHYSHRVPVWFHEGLATLAADGGGADLVGEEAVLAEVRAGNRFGADVDHDDWSRRNADWWGLDISVFYRQSWMFVAHLEASGGWRFDGFVREVQDGRDFDAAFLDAFGVDAAVAARRYFGAIR